MKSVKLAIAFLATYLISTGIPNSPAGAAESGRVLFNGKDLTNFYTWLADTKYADPDRVFSVVDQVDGAPAIRVSGEHWGAFITREEFSNYRLVAEFRWGLLTWGERKTGAMDSGVLLHCQGSDGNTGKGFTGPWMRSVECQIIQGGVGDIILVEGYDEQGSRLGPKLKAAAGKDRDGEDVYDLSAPVREFARGRINWFGRDPAWKDALGFRGRNDVESGPGKWTRIEVVCDGDKITNVVNGTVVNLATGCTYDRGKIIFQSEGAEIYFRKIEIHPLP